MDFVDQLDFEHKSTMQRNARAVVCRGSEMAKNKRLLDRMLCRHAKIAEEFLLTWTSSNDTVLKATTVEIEQKSEGERKVGHWRTVRTWQYTLQPHHSTHVPTAASPNAKRGAKVVCNFHNSYHWSEGTGGGGGMSGPVASQPPGPKPLRP